MTVFQNGKEVKDAKVSYFEGGQPAHVEIDGVTYDPSAFEFKENAPVKKTRKADSGAMTTKDVK